MSPRICVLPAALLLLFAVACGDVLDRVVPATPEPIYLPLTIAEVSDNLPPYERSDWRHWTDEDGDCQDARQEVLVAESLDPATFRSDRQCRVIAGRWQAPYTDTVVTDPSDLDIDHLVPLANAHRSGGWAWPAERRRQYANFLGDDAHLIAVTASANRQKGADGPEDWRPPDQSYWCEYATAWSRVKRVWNLTATLSEAEALREMLQTCEGHDISSAAPSPIPAETVTVGPSPQSTYTSCDGAEAAGEERVRGSRATPRGFLPSWFPPPATVTATAWYAKGRCALVDIKDGVRVSVPVGDGSIEYFYYELGDPAGEPVVFMHTGGAGVSAYMCWYLNLDAVANAGYRVLAPDSPGFGRSSPGNAVEGMRAFLDAHGIDRAHLVGNSGGGMAATNFSARYPDRVRSLTLSGGEPRVDNEATKPIVPLLGQTARMNFAREMLAKEELSVEDMRRATGDFFYDREHPQVDAVTQMRLDTLSDPELLERVREEAIGQIARGRAATPDEVYAAITAPTYLLHGRDEPYFYSEEDEPILIDAAIKVAFAIRDCRCTLLPHCGHWPQIEKSDEYNRLLLGFLADVSAWG